MARFNSQVQLSEDSDSLQREVQRLSDFLDKCPLLDGELIEDVSIRARSGGIQQDTIVSHNLGREYKGFIFVNSNNSYPFESSTLNNQKSKRLILTTLNSGATTVSIWIF
jgi:hypothetical protein